MIIPPLIADLRDRVTGPARAPTLLRGFDFGYAHAMARRRVSRSYRRAGLLLALSGPLAACGAPAPAGELAPAQGPKAGPPAAAGDPAAPDPGASSPAPSDTLAPADPKASSPVPSDRPPLDAKPGAQSPALAPQTLVATGAGGPLTLHLAALREGDITLHALVDGALAARGDDSFALAAPGAGSLRRETAWLRGLPRGDWTPIDDLTALGGRWPDAAFFSFTVEYDRSGGGHMAYRWRTDRWTRLEPAASARGFDGLYAAYAGGPGGAVLGLRTDALGSASHDATPAKLRTMRAALARTRPAIDRLDAPGPGAWPELPTGPAALDLASFADGGLVVLRDGPVLQRWTPGAKAWQTLPPIGYASTGYYESATLVARDPARVYVHSCADTRTRDARLHRLVDDAWQEIATPDGKCVWSLSEDADGALWLVSTQGLYRHPAPGPAAGPTPSPDWQAFTLPAVQLPARPRLWRHDDVVGEWTQIAAEPAREQALMPSRVLALGPGDLWLIATAGDSPVGSGRYRKVALTTRSIDAPLVLPDVGRIALEMSGLGDEPPGPDCYEPLLELGAVTDAPATARPAALVDPALADLAVVSHEVDGGHDVAVLWMTGRPLTVEAHARLTALAERLRPSYPLVRLACRLPVVVDVLP